MYCASASTICIIAATELSIFEDFAPTRLQPALLQAMIEFPTDEVGDKEAACARSLGCEPQYGKAGHLRQMVAPPSLQHSIFSIWRTLLSIAIPMSVMTVLQHRVTTLEDLAILENLCIATVTAT